ncbi:carboxypeptidase-like regulatory domain-containing protein [Pyxidicoccus caerfyrddinensis]|uniref:carboxypeptidase-like regulatory domain-containing protein n=1 Tax=Pyxidicoccus caerfyrddinensis TaxID=2709663 RepID=UPI001F085743|nr:carboxypeptidase-like regulatory domain-containing protein [Pyxidicoccus caerfyrddinensis]
MSRTLHKAGWSLAAALVVAGLVLWWVWPRTLEAEAVPARPADVVEAVTPTPVVSEVPTRAEPEGPRLRAVLEGEHPFHGEARVGAAFISEEDRRTWEAAKREGGGGAGPERLEDLANVAEWRPAVVTPSASGGTLGPEPVPVANRYRVLAWEPDGTFWWGDGVPESVEGLVDLGVLRARRPTGVRVRLAGARPEQGPFSVRLERVVDADSRVAERASKILPVVAHAAPVVAAALRDGTPVPLQEGVRAAPADTAARSEGALVPSRAGAHVAPVGASARSENTSVSLISGAGETQLLPLPPDPAVRLWLRSASGREGGPVEVALREGRVETVVLDVDALFPGGVGGTVTLRGRVLLEGSDRPPPGARLLGPEGEAVALEPDGRFTAPGLPSWQASRFTVQLEAPPSGRPVSPARHEFEFTPEPGATDAEVTWRVPVYRWLVLRMEGFTRAQLQARARRPYPVFLLQRRDGDGPSWLTHPADVFQDEEDGVAVSLLQPGTYRVLAAASPYEVHASTSAELGGNATERTVSVQVDEGGVPCEVHVTVAGAPVYGALVTSASTLGSLPPARGRTDAEGRWRLGRVRADSLHLEVEADGHPPWAGEVAAACEASGVVEVRL